MFARALVKRRVRYGIVKRVDKGHALIIYLADVCPELQRVVAMNPGKIVREVVDRSDTAHGVRLVGGKKHKAESDIVSVAVSTLRKCLARVAVPEIVDPIVSDGPGMTCGNTSWVAPHLGGDRVRIRLRQVLMVVNHVPPPESVLLAGYGVIQLQNM